LVRFSFTDTLLPLCMSSDLSAMNNVFTQYGLQYD